MDEQDRQSPPIRQGNGRGSRLPRRSSPTATDGTPSRRSRGGVDRAWSLDTEAADRYLRAREDEIDLEPLAGGDDQLPLASPEGEPLPARAGRHRREVAPEPSMRRRRTVSSDDLPLEVERVELSPTGRPSRRTARGRRTDESAERSRPASRRLSNNRPSSIRLPTALQSSSLVSDQVALALIGMATFSLLLMWVSISSRIGSLPDSIVVRRGPEGDATLFDSPTSLWQMPLIATIATLMNGVVAWVTHASDRFASRMVLGLTAVIHLLVWVAIVQFVW